MLLTTRKCNTSWDIYLDDKRAGNVQFWGPNDSWIGWRTFYPNQGIMSMIVPLIIDATGWQGEAHIANYNFASQRLAQKCGFVYAGQKDKWNQRWNNFTSQSGFS